MTEVSMVSVRSRQVLIVAFVLAWSLVPDIALAQALDKALFNGMKWRLVGPFRGGRVEAVAGLPEDPNVYYFGAVAGGLWKTSDGGATWKPIFDHESNLSIGAIGIAPSDHNVIYVGTGEPCLRNTITFGNGMYKSTDGGSSWKHIGLEDTQHVSKVLVDPHNSNIVFVAAVGHASGPNAERGVFRSDDGGKGWNKVLYKDDKTGAVDLVFDPANSRVLYASLYQEYRAPWILNAGGPGSGIYKSTDGGNTWTHLEGHGLPEVVLGRIGLAVSADPNRIYALVEASEKGGMYRSDDSGADWTLVNGDHSLSQRPWYFSHIFADPKNPDVVYSLAYRMLRSIDGGHTFTALKAPHGDHHALWIDPNNPKRMINGNDGGATVSVDGGVNWSSEDNQPTAQFYHVIADNRFRYYIYGAQQDNSTVAIASRTDHGVIDRPDWYAVGGGESGYIAPDPHDPDIVVAGAYAGTLTRFDHRTGQAQMISPWPQFMDGLHASQVQHRFNWTSPTVFSLHDANTIYNGAEVLFKSANGGLSWKAISSDLTRNDKSKQGSSGGAVTKDDTGTEYYDTIFTIAESPIQRDLIWVGSDDGLIHITSDGGQNWADVTPKEAPEWGRVDLIEASPHAPGVAYAAIDRHLLDDLRPYIYRTSDFGRNWTPITSGLPKHAYVHAVREDPERKGLLFAATELGVFVSFDDGMNWQPLQLNLPAAPVYDLIVKNCDLVVATHGRSFWILDDISPLRQIDARMTSEDVVLLRPDVAFRVHDQNEEVENAANRAGANPKNGAVIDYILKVVPTDKITLEILDAKGSLIRRFASEPRPSSSSTVHPRSPEEAAHLPADAGMNRFVWDLRLDPPAGVAGAVYMEGSHLQGTTVLPGTYTVRLIAQGKTLSAPLQVKLDPTVTTSEADLQKQFDLAMKISERISQTHETVNHIRYIHRQLLSLAERVSGAPGSDAIIAASRALDQKVGVVEDALFQVHKTAEKDSFNYGGRLNDMFIALHEYVEQADTAPTEQTYEVFDYLDQQLMQQLRQWDVILKTDIPTLNRVVHDKDIPPLGLSVSGASER
jgi:photosystem II stability/assembly factor-like uncharacterized protein